MRPYCLPHRSGSPPYRQVSTWIKEVCGEAELAATESGVAIKCEHKSRCDIRGSLISPLSSIILHLT